ncbi:MAG: galactitol-1-phosphate 5-dehydrogenase [Anaerolineae bacterium]|nr:galactitol-1-phosphate 5-dehydrogenase [Anaerolineae bacterium]
MAGARDVATRDVATPGGTMQALVFTAIRKMELQTTPAPRLTAPDDVLVRVRAVGVCGSDLHGYTGQSGRRTPPMIMGHEAAGEVVAIGPAVTNVKPGDQVAIQPVRFCGQCVFCREGKASLCANRQVLGVHPAAGGAYAEWLVWPAGCLFPMPAGMTYEQASFGEPLAVCLHALRLADIKPYDSVALVGSGPIGLLTLAILRTLGLRQVFVSDVSDERLAVARSLGASVTINPTRDNPRAVVEAHTEGLGADVSIEAVGLGVTAQQAIDVTKNGGTVVWIGNNMREIQIDMQSVVTRELRVQGTYAMNDLDFGRALGMLADGAVDIGPLLTQRATLAEGPTLFEDLLHAPQVIKCVILP